MVCRHAELEQELFYSLRTADVESTLFREGNDRKRREERSSFCCALRQTPPPHHVHFCCFCLFDNSLSTKPERTADRPQMNGRGSIPRVLSTLSHSQHRMLIILQDHCVVIIIIVIICGATILERQSVFSCLLFAHFPVSRSTTIAVFLPRLYLFVTVYNDLSLSLALAIVTQSGPRDAI